MGVLSLSNVRVDCVFQHSQLVDHAEDDRRKERFSGLIEGKIRHGRFPRHQDLPVRMRLAHHADEGVTPRYRACASAPFLCEPSMCSVKPSHSCFVARKTAFR